MTRGDFYLLAVAGVAAALFLSNKGARDFGEGVGSAAIDLVDGVVTGSVVSIGETVGIPRTNKSLGQQQFEAGNWWDASFNLPAGDFIGNVYNSIFSE